MYFLRWEFRISLAAVLIEHLAEKCGKAGVIVGSNFGIEVFITVVIIVIAFLVRTAYETAVKDMAGCAWNFYIVFP